MVNRYIARPNANVARLRLLQNVLHGAFARGVARGEATANLKRNLPAIMDRISKEFLDGEQEIQRNNLRMGIESWSVDAGERRRKRLEAVIKRVIGDSGVRG